jgi:hypothetical protein
MTQASRTDIYNGLYVSAGRRQGRTCGGDRGFGVSAPQHWDYLVTSTLCMKIAKVQGILFDLASVRRRESIRTNLALDDNDQAAGKNNHIDSSAQSVQWVLKENRPIPGLRSTLQEFGQNTLKLRNKSIPCLGLSSILRNETVRRIRLLQDSDYSNRLFAKELGDCSPQVRCHKAVSAPAQIWRAGHPGPKHVTKRNRRPPATSN